MTTYKAVRGFGTSSRLGWPTINLIGVGIVPGVYQAETELGLGFAVACRNWVEVHIADKKIDARVNELKVHRFVPLEVGRGGTAEILALGTEALAAKLENRE